MENLNALDSGVASFAQRLAKSNPEATALIKRATWAGTDDWPTLLEERAATSGRLVLSEFTKQAIAAFSAR
jgi:methylglutaconyl-CoA hydratase